MISGTLLLIVEPFNILLAIKHRLTIILTQTLLFILSIYFKHFDSFYCCCCFQSHLFLLHLDSVTREEIGHSLRPLLFFCEKKRLLVKNFY